MSKARVLVIDDHLYFRTYMEGILQEGGYEVRTAVSGAEGLETLAREGPFDVVLTDLVMPGMDGIETVRRIRSRDPEQQVLVVTGVGDVRSAVEALRVGAAEYILKPVERDDLLHSIASVLEQQRLRREHGRLVSENMAFLGVLSTLERGFGLLSTLNREELAQRLLDLLCAETKARSGVLWVRVGGSDGGEFARLAVCGTPPGDETLPPPFVVGGSSSDPGNASLYGEPQHADGGAALWVPSAREGTLWAVARLGDFVDGPVPAGKRATCAKLGELAALAFQNAERAAGLERQGLRDSLTGLHTRAFLEEAVWREIHRSRRSGRPFVLVCLEAGDPGGPSLEPRVARRLGAALERSLRPAEVIASEGARLFWALAAEADPLGSVVVKSRLVDALRAELGGSLPVAVGTANFPADGETFDDLEKIGLARIAEDRGSLIHTLRLAQEASLSGLIGALRGCAVRMRPAFVVQAIELLLDEVRSRPDLRGLIFLAPGEERPTVLTRLAALGRRSLATSIFLATEGDTVPVGPGVTPLLPPRGVAPGTTWLLRFGDAPPYVLIAGPPGREGRAVFHSNDRSLVEHVVLRLRAEVGFGVAGRT